MAQLELRHTTIRIIDGSGNTAAVDDTLVNGDTTMEIDTLGTPEAIDIGTRFSVVGSSLRHYVTARNANERQQVVVDATAGNYTLDFNGQVTANIAFDATASAVQSALEALSNIAPGDVIVTLPVAGTYVIEFAGTYLDTGVTELIATDVDLTGGGDSVVVTTLNAGGTTWEIDFSPALATATGIPADDAVITFDGRTLEVKVGDGALSYTENRELEYVLDRGTLDTVREGDDQPVEVNMDFIWEFLRASSTDDIPTIEDAIKQRGLASDWETSDTDDPCAPYAVDIEIEYDPPCGAVQGEIILLQDFRWDSLEHNAVDAVVSMTGRCNVKEATVTRA